MKSVYDNGYQMMKTTKYELYIRDKDGISTWEHFDKLEDAKYRFEKIRKEEPRTKTLYELNEVMVEFDEDGEEIQTILVNNIDEFIK